MQIPDFNKKSAVSSLVPAGFAKLLLLAFAAAAGAALLAALVDKLSQNRFQRKLMACADSIQAALPTLRRASELYIAQHEQETPVE